MDIQLLAELEGHDDRAWHIAWNPKQPILASCSADKTVRLYNYEVAGTEGTGAPPKSITFHHNTTIPTGHTKTVRAVAWAPSGQTLATASFDANIGIWAQEENEEAGDATHSGDWECMSLLEGHETECKSVAYSNTGTLLASCSRDKTVWIWEVHPDSDFECMGVLMEHTQDVKCVAWHPTEEILASASYDDTVKLYVEDPSDDWFCAATLTGHGSTVWTLAWEPTRGRYLASGSEDNTIRLWRRLEGPGEMQWECVDVLEGHERSVYSISWSPGHRTSGSGETGIGFLGWLASTGGDGTVFVWEITEHADVATGGKPKVAHKLLARVRAAHGVHDVNCVVWCPRSGLEDIFATAGDDGHVKVWRFVEH